MLKAFLKKYAVEIIEAYLAAAVCYICMYTMGASVWVVAVVIAFVDSYLKTPIVNALRVGNEADQDIFRVKHLELLKKIVKSIIICAIIVFIYYVINTYAFSTSVEPITFGILYELLNIWIGKMIKKKL
ncbi:MAG: hypothetical protein R3Y47_03380 [Lachnospiraceae bacterium]